MADAMRPGAPDCGLYLRIGDEFVFGDLLPKLRQLFFITTRSDYEKNMHVLEFPALPRLAEEVRGLIGYAQQNGFVAVVRGDVARAAEWGADGVILSAPDDIQAARTRLGEGAIIGLQCGADFALAERSRGLGIDYAALAARADHVARWSTATDVPLLAEGVAESCEAQVRAGATFIECAAFVLGHPAGVMQGAADMLHRIDRALAARSAN